jgi:ATP-dependent RNA helicase DeaD
LKLFQRVKGIFKNKSKGAPDAAKIKGGAETPARESAPGGKVPESNPRRKHPRRGRGRSGNRAHKPGGGDPRQGAGASQATDRPESPQRKKSDSAEQESTGYRGKSSKAKARHHKPRHRGKRTDLGGVPQRMDFPELLDIDTGSSEFLENEFGPLGLSNKLVLTLAANRFRIPTDIQKAVIPAALRGADIMGQAQTGTGKTIAFLMPIFEKLEPAHSPSVEALIVVPTRELCRQVSWEARRFGRSLDIKVINLYGGTSINKELQALHEGAHIVVGTPGRLLDHIFNKNVDLTNLKTLVLDEADRMFDIGFRQDIIKIIKACPKQRQIMLLSATLEGEVENVSRVYMRDPVKLYVSKDEISVESIWQRFVPVERPKKIDMVVKILETQKPTQSLIFTNTKRMSDAVALNLGKKGFKARCIHSDLNQNKRERIMDAFRTGKIEHLVATDVAARGLDITGISHVINYDIPDNPEDYVHRVGRTGRMGAAGKAYTFVTHNEGKQLTLVEKLINKQLDAWEKD